jgi:hypothetical protein
MMKKSPMGEIYKKETNIWGWVRRFRKIHSMEGGELIPLNK